MTDENARAGAYAALPGVKLWFVDSGGAGVPIVLLHPNTGTVATWEPQIAAFADQHFLIEKTERRGRTQTGVRRMEQSERVEEIARMLSGASLTETSRRHAEQMLAQSR